MSIETKKLLEPALSNNPLGKASPYIEYYTAELLFPIARQLNRDKLNIPNPLPFHGFDIWNAYEISWLNKQGKPVIAMATFYVSCSSPNLIESKSLKLYLNSFNQTKFDSMELVKQTIINDLNQALKTEIKVEFFTRDKTSKLLLNPQPVDPFCLADAHTTHPSQGICLDDLDISCDTYHVHTDFLTIEKETCQENLYSYLLKSNCPFTGQPDWAGLFIHYAGQKINHAGLLRYIVSLRRHTEFHENCVERIFQDITIHCHPEKLTVYARYARRGGININPFRSNFESLKV